MLNSHTHMILLEPDSQGIPATANATRRSCWEVLCCYCCSRAESHPSRSADVHGKELHVEW